MPEYTRMRSTQLKIVVLTLFVTKVIPMATAFAATEALGNGYFHHGVATPVSTHRGVVATVDGEGHDIVLAWLYDCRGGYALLVVDAETGKSEQMEMPFPPGGDGPYASILSSRNKFYTHFNSHFTEFDPVSRSFTFTSATAPQMAMGMTEDDNGVIWSVTYPDSGVVSYDPASGVFKDYGHVYKQNWRQYQRDVAADDKGWIYFGIGTAASQIIAFDPQTSTAKPMLTEEERIKGSGFVSRHVDGRVYGHNGAGAPRNWYQFYNGERVATEAPADIPEKPLITGSQALFHDLFQDGRRLKTLDLVNRTIVVEDPGTGTSRTLSIEYTSEGADIMGVAASPDGTLCGGTSFPMRFFSFNPETDTWINRDSYGQWNTVVRQGDRFFVGGYGGGFLLEWDPSKEWVATEKDRTDSNPLFLAECTPTIHRPHELLAHTDGENLVLAGTPGYGYTGGGLLFWNRKTKTATVIEHTGILPQHATISLATLPDGNLIGGTTTSPGTGGERKAKEAELYIMNMATKQVEWHEAVFPGVQEYTDMCAVPGGQIYGIADRRLFFVFDAVQKKVIYRENIASRFGLSCYQQGPRVFVSGPDGSLYMLFQKGVARVEPATNDIVLLAESPVTIGIGGDMLNGSIYFGNGSHLYSFKVPEK